MILQQLNKRLERFRSCFDHIGVEGFIVPSNDEFQSEYVDEAYNRLKYLTGFSGSNGLAIITKSSKFFFTDGRYLIQAKNELTDFAIHDLADLEHFKIFEKLGYDPKLFSIKSFNKYKHLNLVSCDNIIDKLWSRDTTANGEFFFYPDKYSGLSTKNKLANLRGFLKNQQFDAIVITDSSNVSWLLNIRSNHNLSNPVLLSNLILSSDGRIKLFTPTKLDIKNIECYALSELEDHLIQLRNKRVAIDPISASIWHKEMLRNPIYIEDPCTLAKAIKNNIEQSHAKRINKIDSIALIKFFYWLEKHKHEVSEVTVASKLIEFRSLNKDFVAPSFPSICGFKENGAIIHYKADEKTNKKIEKDGLLLVDSGGHYFGGTTDITRVVLIGKATHKQKLYYTLVLKGHIAIASAKFPVGTRGKDLDPLARQFLWKHEKDYSHGTGHGVGNFLSVHEGPQRISKYSDTKLLPGMIISNEPGYYEENEYGIRIENLLMIKQKKEFLYFETLSLVPIEKKLILKKLLSKDEITWLNNYHASLFKKLSTGLTKAEQNWLKKKILF